jgi:5'(3')-deoxyribonucleotidase
MSTVGATKSVSIDFDSVLADTMIAWTMEYNRLKHTNITKNEITYWDIGMAHYRQTTVFSNYSIVSFS